MNLRSEEQIEKIVKRARIWKWTLGVISICLAVSIAPLVILSSDPSSTALPSWYALLAFPIVALIVILVPLADKIDSLPGLTSGEKLVVLLGRLLDNVKSYGKFSDRDRKRAGKRVQFAATNIDSWVDETYSYGKQDLMSEEHEAFSKDLKLVMSGLRKCIQRGMDIPAKTIGYLQSIVSQKEHLHRGYHDPCQQCSPSGNYIRAYLKKAIGHLQSAGIDDTTPEITVGYRLRKWLGKRTLWAMDLILLMIWALAGASILLASISGVLVLPVEVSIVVLVMFLVGFFAIPPFIHTLYVAYTKRQQ
ncbi:MAG: hypothetical protein KAW39_05255 [Thermoplasmata archaeon]|nr:hypothetical protein [Thermoplasmata archaeon]